MKLCLQGKQRLYTMRVCVCIGREAVGSQLSCTSAQYQARITGSPLAAVSAVSKHVCLKINF